MSQKDGLHSKHLQLLIKEAGLTATCLEQGLTSLRKASFTKKWYYYQAFFLLSIGIERLLKLTVVTLSRIKNDRLPNNRELKAYGHNINKLFNTLMNELNPNSNFLEDDEINSYILKFFTEFALRSRYYNLDSLSGIETNNDPLHHWKDIVKIIEQRHCHTKELSEQERNMLKLMSETSFILHTDEYGNPITNLINLYEQGLNLDKIQGYSVFYIHRLVVACVELLDIAGGDTYMLPRFSEFFTLFGSNPVLTNSDIRRRKNWNYLSERS
jgi:hypothetical protein